MNDSLCFGCSSWPFQWIGAKNLSIQWQTAKKKMWTAKVNNLLFVSLTLLSFCNHTITCNSSVLSRLSGKIHRFIRWMKKFLTFFSHTADNWFTLWNHLTSKVNPFNTFKRFSAVVRNGLSLHRGTQSCHRITREQKKKGSYYVNIGVLRSIVLCHLWPCDTSVSA